MSEAEGEWRPKVSLAFRALGGAAPYLDGKPTARIYVEKRDLKALVEEYIHEGRLTLGETAQPSLKQVEGGGGFYVALLQEQEGSKPVEAHTPSMHPVTVYDEERLMMRLLKENRPHEFKELLRSYMRVDKRRRQPTWRELNPHSPRSAKEARRPPQADGARQDRTVLLLNVHPTMGEPWSLWESHLKSQVAGFLAEALQSMYHNSNLIKYGGPGGKASRDHEADPRNALEMATLANPERMVVITDKLDHETLRHLDTMGRSGVRTLVVYLGDGEHPCTGDPTPIQVIRLRVGGDLANMMHGLAAWA